MVSVKHIFSWIVCVTISGMISHGSGTPLLAQKAEIPEDIVYLPAVMQAGTENYQLTALWRVGGEAGQVILRDTLAYVSIGSELAIIDVADPKAPRPIDRIALPDPETHSFFALSGDYAFFSVGGAAGDALRSVNLTDPEHPYVAVDSIDGVNGIAVDGNILYLARSLGGGRYSFMTLDIVQPDDPKALGSYEFPEDDLYGGGVVVAGGLAFMPHGKGLALIDVTDPRSPSRLATVDIAEVNSVAVSGDFAYVGAGDLHILDLSDPGRPVEAGIYATAGRVRHLAAAGDMLYVATADGGRALDITSPAQPTAVGTWPHAGPMAAAADFVYVASGSGVSIVDVSNLANPSITGGLDTPGDAWGIDVAGAYAYVADRGGGLRIVDISDPAHVSAVGAYATAGDALGVSVSGDYAYVAVGDRGVQIVDVSNPMSPTAVGALDTPGIATTLVLDGREAYVADGGAGLRVVDIADPSDPDSVAVYPTAGETLDIAIAGQVAVVANGYAGLPIVNVENPAMPVARAVYTDADYVQGVAISGTLVYAATGPAGLHLIDISNGSQPRRIALYDTPGNAIDVAVSGQRVYIADGAAGLHVWDIADPAHPVDLGAVDTPGDAREVVVQGGYAYIAGGTGGLHVIDIANLGGPVELGRTLRNPTDVAVSHGIAYVTDRDGTLYGVDLANPGGAWVISSLAIPWDPTFVSVAGTHAFVVANPHYDPDKGAQVGGGLYVVDIQDPSEPVTVASYPLPASIDAMALSGDYLHMVYSAADSTLLDTIDVSNPTAPAKVSSFPLSEMGTCVSAALPYVYVCAGTEFQIIDFSDPGKPQKAAALAGHGWVSDLAVSGNTAYVIGHGGLAVVDITNPSHPLEIGNDHYPTDLVGIAVVGRLAFVASERGVLLLDVSEPESPKQRDFLALPRASGVRVFGDALFVMSDGDTPSLSLLRYSGP